MQLDIFEAIKARDTGLQSTAITNAEWMAAALAELRAYLQTRRELRLEEFRAEWERREQPAPVSPHAWGALARVAIGRQWIEPIGYVKAESVRTHRHPVQLYKSLIGA